MDNTGANQSNLEGVPDVEGWPLISARTVGEALRDQGESEEIIVTLTPALEQLHHWRAPVPGPASTQMLVEALNPLLPPLSSRTSEAPTSISSAVTLARVAAVAAPERLTAARPSTVREALQERARRPTWERELGYFLEIALAQIGLLRPRFWIASGIIAAIGMLTIPGGLHNYEVQIATLRIMGPLLAVLAVSFVFRSSHLGVLEIELSCFTSPVRLILARLTVVLAYDVVLGLLASFVLAYAGAVGGDNLLLLTLHWLAPLLLVAGTASLLSTRMSVGAAAIVAYAGWLLLVAWTMGEQGQGVLSSVLGASEGLIAVIGLVLLSVATLRARSLASSTLARV